MLDTFWPCDSSCSPFTLGPCKDFCRLFSKHLFCNSDLSKCSIWHLSRSSGPYQIFILGIPLEKHRCGRVIQAKHLFVFQGGASPVNQSSLLKFESMLQSGVITIRFIFWLIQTPNPPGNKMKTHSRRVPSPTINHNIYSRQFRLRIVL